MILLRHVVAGMDGGHPYLLGAHLEGDFHCLQVQPTHRKVQGNGAKDRKIGYLACNLRSICRDHHMALDQDGAHPLLFCGKSQVYVVHDPGENVRSRMNVNIDGAFQ